MIFKGQILIAFGSAFQPHKRSKSCMNPENVFWSKWPCTDQLPTNYNVNSLIIIKVIGVLDLWVTLPMNLENFGNEMIHTAQREAKAISNCVMYVPPWIHILNSVYAVENTRLGQRAVQLFTVHFLPALFKTNNREILQWPVLDSGFLPLHWLHWWYLSLLKVRIINAT